MNAFLVLMSLVNWLHLAATVAWIGGMTTNLWVVLPSMRASLEPPVMGKLMNAVMRRFRVLTYVSIALLVITGGLMFRSNVAYAGFGFANVWSAVSLIKHIIVVVLIILAIYAYEGLARKVTRLAAKGPSADLARLQKRQMAFAATGLVLGLVILLLTGTMSAISATA